MHRNGKSLEIEFVPSGEATFYFYDASTHDEREGSIGLGESPIREFVEQLV